MVLFAALWITLGPSKPGVISEGSGEFIQYRELGLVNLNGNVILPQRLCLFL